MSCFIIIINHQICPLTIAKCLNTPITSHCKRWSWMKVTMMRQSLVMENRLMTLLSMTVMPLMILSHWWDSQFSKTESHWHDSSQKVNESRRIMILGECERKIFFFEKCNSVVKFQKCSLQRRQVKLSRTEIDCSDYFPQNPWHIVDWKWFE